MEYIDVAGDMIGVYEWNVTDYATQWFLPTQDLINIYQVRVSPYLLYYSYSHMHA